MRKYFDKFTIGTQLNLNFRKEQSYPFCPACKAGANYGRISSVCGLPFYLLSVWEIIAGF